VRQMLSLRPSAAAKSFRKTVVRLVAGQDPHRLPASFVETAAPPIDGLELLIEVHADDLTG
jgi:hypothetical protein